MYQETIHALAQAAGGKADQLRTHPIAFVISSIQAGAYIGFGVLLSFTIGGLLNGEPYAKVLMGISFGVALSLVVIAGAVLFTGNNLVMTCGALSHTARWIDAIKLWVVCWLGNLAGAVLLALMFRASGLLNGNTASFIASAAAGKVGAPAIALFFRGVLCNVLVCLAVWSGFRCKSESGKLIMIFWCLFAFFTTGFEHSIANMTLLTLALMAPSAEAAINIGGWAYNLAVVTAGNMVGGILLVALPYHAISSEKN